MRPVFVLSTGRTGTKFIADYFAEYSPGVVSLHEPRFSRHFRILSNMFLRNKAGKSLLVKVFKMTRPSLFRADVEFDQYWESNNFLFGYAPIFEDMFKEFKIIHIVRDPRDYIRSHINHGVFTGNKRLAKFFVPYWFMNVKKFIPFDHQPDSYEILAARWLIVNNYLKENSPAENYLCVKFEELFHGDALEKICLHTELPYKRELHEKMMKEKVNKGRLELAPKWPLWEKETCRKGQQICGKQMEEYGYGTEKEWKQKTGSVK